ncbi:MAG: glutamine--tRNA ligase, partial [Saprospiraceae bacterium]|nr:glutamine--tRNA ligase [Saprospiraceae bacterium]
DTSGVKAKGTLHWVSSAHAIPAQVRLYDRLFSVEDPLADPEVDFKEYINPDSLQVNSKVLCEPALKDAKLGESYQFMRKGYFCLDKDSSDGQLIFNRTVGLRDSWAKKVSKKK